MLDRATCAVWLCAAAASVVGSTAARAEPSRGALADAQRAYADVDYSRCRDKAADALEQPGERSERLDAYRFLGLCAAALGDTEAAREAFKKMLAVDKDARLPDGLSPRFTSTFREAKGSFVTGAPLQLVLAKETVDGGTRNVRLKVVDDLEMLAKVAWRGAAGSSGGPMKKAPMMELELPAEVDVTVVGLDAAGGEITTLLLEGKKEEPDDVPPPPPPGGNGGADVPWGVIAGVAVGVLVLSAAAAGAALLLAPPQAVTVKTDVVFGQ